MTDDEGVTLLRAACGLMADALAELADRRGIPRAEMAAALMAVPIPTSPHYEAALAENLRATIASRVAAVAPPGRLQ
jgi:hypothetical protein